jgi:acetoin utilization protein AcuB
MLVKHWMSTDVVSLTPDRSMMKASKLMKDKNISRLPIVDESGTLIGIVSDRDIKDASPSKATTLDMHELYYLLSDIKLKDIMTKNPMTITAEDTVEKAAVMMLENNFGGLPVVDENKKLVGIITDTDVFRVMTEITGVYHGGIQVCLRIPTASGSLLPVLECLRDHDARVMSILTQNVDEHTPEKAIFIRLRDMDKPHLKKIKAAMAEKFDVLYWVTDSVNPVV